MAVQVFDPRILQSPDSIESFLKGKEEIQAVLRSDRSSPSVMTGRWNVSINPNLPEICYELINIFLKLVSCALYVLCLRGLAKRVWVLAGHVHAHGNCLKLQRVFDAHFLVPSISAHRLDTHDFYLQKSISLQLFLLEKPVTITFFHREGICRGMCWWFAYLYLHTHGQFSNSHEHVIAIGNQFAEGAPWQATFLQSEVHWNLLARDQNSRELRNPGDLDWRLLFSSTPGVYGVHTLSHQVLYIKANDNKQYLFEPSGGVFEVPTLELFKKVMDPYLRKHDYSRYPIIIDQYALPGE